METQTPAVIEVATTVNAPISKVWEYWTQPQHVMQWNNASPDWHTPKAENDLRKGGAFSYIMAARDGSFSFDFGGIYDAVEEHRYIEYTIGDGRKVKVSFDSKDDNTTHIVENFEAEKVNSIDLQRGGWQAILDNFKKYTENN